MIDLLSFVQLFAAAGGGGSSSSSDSTTLIPERGLWRVA